jgi:hypothetical protein
MKNLSKITIFLCLILSLAKATTILPSHNSSDFAAKVEEKVKKIGAIALAVAIFYPLQYISTYAHEYGHALPNIMSGKDYNVVVKADKYFLLYGWMEGDYSATPFLTTILGPIAGIFTQYVQSGAIQFLHDSLLQKKSFSENFVSALKAPITITQKIIAKSEELFSSMINSKQRTQKKEKPMVTSDEPRLTSIKNQLQSMLMLAMFQQFIYGFLPNKLSGEIEELKSSISDGESIWRQLLGSEPTFFIDPSWATNGLALGLVAIGAMKAIWKKYTEKNLDTEEEEEEAPEDISPTPETSPKI